MSAEPTSERHQRIKNIFLDALDIPAEARAAWLDEVARGDEDLRSEIDSLLKAHEEIEDTDALELPHLQRDALSSADPMVGRDVGPWRLVEQIGSGGMGTVYKAERADGAYDRTVAVKLLKPGGDVDRLSERLRAERNVLARLEHRHVARLYDGGIAENGVPYLALEYVDGMPITGYCGTHSLRFLDRIDLFVQVCDAVAYAHRNLIVHRDLKPSNILVTPKGEAKLLDFGIAKLLEESDEAPVLTRTGTSAMTPAYASPEQVRNGPITTATDVYSLGVLLFELLTVRRPYDLAGKSAAEVERLVCEATPPKPSAVAGDAQLRGDLDTIILKALAKEPERRYASAEALAADLRRFGDGLPIQARAPRPGYRARKFVQRHRLGVAAATALLLALVGGLGATLWQARLASIERDRAERRFDVAREAAGSMLFEIHNAVARVPGTTEARELIVSTSLTYLNRLAAEATDDVALRLDLAEAYRRVGDVLGNPADDNLGRTEEALDSYERGLALIPDLPPGDNLAGRAAQVRGALYEERGTVEAFVGRLDSALTSLDSALANYRRSTILDPDNLDWRVRFAIGHINLGDYSGHPHFPNVGRPDSALAHYEQARYLLESIPEDQRGDGARRMLGLVFERMGSLYLEERSHDAALTAYRRSLVFREQLGQRDGAGTDEIRDLGIAHEKVGQVYWNQGRPREALEELEQAAEIYRALAEADPQSVRARQTLAISHIQFGDVLGGPAEVTLGDRASARGRYREALALLRPIAATDTANAFVRELIVEAEGKLRAIAR